jgi:hypothetical protein
VKAEGWNRHNHTHRLHSPAHTARTALSRPATGNPSWAAAGPKSHRCQSLGLCTLNRSVTLDILASLQCECSLEPLAGSNARVLEGTSGILEGSAELCFLLPKVTCSDGLPKNQGCSLSQRKSSWGTQLRQAAWLATGPKKKTSRLRERVEPAAASTCGAGKQVKTHRYRHKVSSLRRSRVWLACGLQLTEALPGRLCH